jgi:hypothetical protein
MVINDRSIGSCRTFDAKQHQTNLITALKRCSNKDKKKLYITFEYSMSDDDG